MERLWAPWRLSYVANAKPPAADDPCFICANLAAGRQHDAENLIAERGERSVTVLNRFPYNNGHLLVAPNAHKAELAELGNDEIVEIQRTIARLVEVLRAMMKPDGFNIGLNLGRSAGAGLPGHLHWHIVPRWNGDTNFMPVLSDTRVIVQSLEQFHALLCKELGSNGRA